MQCSHTAPSLLHGLLVLNARSGNLVYSQRFSPAFGLSTFEQLGDELRLGAMLFALHLNAAAAAEAGAGAGLTSYHLGGVAVRFCESATTELLLVLFVPVALGTAAAGFLASEVLRRFEACFAKPLASPPVRPLTRRTIPAAGVPSSICGLLLMTSARFGELRSPRIVVLLRTSKRGAKTVDTMV